MAKRTDTKPSQHELHRLLADYGFPPGLLPDKVKSYRLDAATGKFQATLSRPCQVKRAGIPVHYDTKLSGTLEKGRFRDLKGVKAKQVLWVPVSSVEVDGDQLAFAAGPIRRRLPASDFS